jgi:hypothetical protein
MLFTQDNKPNEMPLYQKVTKVQMIFVTEPFEVKTQEGIVRIAPDTVEDWENGYYIAYPEDGSKPYPISPSFVRKNYSKQ